MTSRTDPATRLNGFAKAHEFACRRHDAGERSLVIVRTGQSIQPFRVTTAPRPSDDVIAIFAE